MGNNCSVLSCGETNDAFIDKKICPKDLNYNNIKAENQIINEHGIRTKITLLGSIEKYSNNDNYNIPKSPKRILRFVKEIPTKVKNTVIVVNEDEKISEFKNIKKFFHDFQKLKSTNHFYINEIEQKQFSKSLTNKFFYKSINKTNENNINYTSEKNINQIFNLKENDKFEESKLSDRKYSDNKNSHKRNISLSYNNNEKNTANNNEYHEKAKFFHYSNKIVGNTSTNLEKFTKKSIKENNEIKNISTKIFHSNIVTNKGQQNFSKRQMVFKNKFVSENKDIIPRESEIKNNEKYLKSESYSNLKISKKVKLSKKKELTIDVPKDPLLYSVFKQKIYQHKNFTNNLTIISSKIINTENNQGKFYKYIFKYRFYYRNRRFK